MENQVTDKSGSLFQKALSLVPGGVHSPVRSFKGLHTTPRFIQSAKGAYVQDVDQKQYIDFCMSFGPLILGHRYPEVEAKLQEALQRGWSYGACEPYSLELADFIISRIPFIDQIRFVNSGTEAVMTAVRLARGYTGRHKIIKFNGCYHGHLDSMLIKAGSGLAGTAEASSKGVPPGTAQDTLIVELNNLAELSQCFNEHPGQIAAIIIEPLPANNGLLVQDLSFLKELRKLCDQNQSLLIFDEVISGFRVEFGGMATHTGINPDLVTYGKIIGGGLPVGAVAGRKEIMQFLAPVGPVYQAGTLSANPLAMVGGLATLQCLTPEFYSKLESYSESVVSIFNSWLKTQDQFKNLQILRKGSLFWIVPTDQKIKNIKEIPADLAKRFYDLFKALLDKGIYLAPNAYEIGFISIAHDEKVQNDLKDRLFK